MFTGGEVKFLQAIANQVAIVIEYTSLTGKSHKMQVALDVQELMERVKGS